jgi:hypothetical protein
LLEVGRQLIERETVVRGWETVGNERETVGRGWETVGKDRETVGRG